MRGHLIEDRKTLGHQQQHSYTAEQITSFSQIEIPILTNSLSPRKKLKRFSLDDLRPLSYSNFW